MKRITNGVNLVQEVNIENETIVFNFQKQKLFDLQSRNVSNCNLINNDLILEINDESLKPTDDALVEIRLYTHENTEEERLLERIYRNIKDNIKSDETLDPMICMLPDLPFAVPRGKYNAHFTEKTIKLHGASYNYTINYKNILKAFWLEMPEKQMGCFVIGFDKPLIQGQTDYKYTIIQFKTEDELEVTMEDRYQDLPKINQNIENVVSGKYYEVFTRIFKVFTGVNVVVPGEFKNSKSDSCLNCSIGAKQGHLFILNKSFMFVLKPIIYLKFDEVARVEFHRVTSGHTARGFDLEIFTKAGTAYLFSGIDKSESDLLIAFLNKHKIVVTTAKEDEIKDDMEYEDDEDDEEIISQKSEDSEEADDDFIAKDDVEEENESDDEDFNPAEAKKEGKEEKEAKQAKEKKKKE